MKITEVPADHNSDVQTNSASNSNPTLSSTVQQQQPTSDSVLDALIRTPEQTYDQFMGCFTQLTPEDVAEFESRRSNVPPSFSPQGNLGPLARNRNQSSLASASASVLMGSSGQQTVPEDETHQTVQDTNSAALDTHQDSSGSDLEEEIVDVGEVIPSRLMRPESPGRLKLDNFVEDEQTFSSDDDNEDDEQLSSSYQASFNPSTLAANTLQNQSITQSASDPTDELLKALQTIATESEEGRSVSEVAADALIDPRQCQAEENEDDCESESEELVYDPSLDRLNPGEVEEEEGTESNDAVKTVTNLEFKVHAPNEQPNQADTTEVTPSDEVQPFSLDDGFDYDNVVLTPKFTPAEMSILRESARNVRESTENAAS